MPLRAAISAEQNSLTMTSFNLTGKTSITDTAAYQDNFAKQQCDRCVLVPRISVNFQFHDAL